ncbi:MAG: SAM-dependent methyltransferase, partial [Conexibacter sp.]
MTTKVRLDTLLAERGVFDSRSRAAASVLAGEVLLGDERRRAEKPGQLVPDDVVVAVAAEQEFVSRGGRTLANALDAFGLEVTRRPALDVGASPGGFTDGLLQRGAAHVIALDVAYGELHWRIRNDERVTVVERTNARALDPAELPRGRGGGDPRRAAVRDGAQDAALADRLAAERELRLVERPAR